MLYPDQNLMITITRVIAGVEAPLNMVITRPGIFGCDKVVARIDGKLTGNAIRVPTPNVSLAILNLTVGEKQHEEVNNYLRESCIHGECKDKWISHTPRSGFFRLCWNRHA
ncbi:MAG: hypothetical protein Ct9H90mP27_7360 [Gammaproteobacteria bacterium]|nr:MAG: hypothetical protein Ct9H90mP27_7360 [Gammaproteobacteria bacterium]